jgi:cytochrome bd-type quinol oxidase subunit 2
MSDEDFNPGMLLGAAATVISVLAALAALYLWAVNRARKRLNKTATPQERAVIPWLSPLLLPTLVLCLGLVANFAKAYKEKSWPEASNMIITSCSAFMILIFWLKIRKQTQGGIEKRS